MRSTRHVTDSPTVAGRKKSVVITDRPTVGRKKVVISESLDDGPDSCLPNLGDEACHHGAGLIVHVCRQHVHFGRCTPQAKPPLLAQRLQRRRRRPPILLHKTPKVMT